MRKDTIQWSDIRVCAADNAAHMVQGRLRSSTADAKTTAVQRRISLNFLITLLKRLQSLCWALGRLQHGKGG